ncbi:MAG: biotin/lipoyl-binding protein [Proteobacteria bacterium]|nr:biotin/lipoyl-binding protein [Pseudomonadota bacterium]
MVKYEVSINNKVYTARVKSYSNLEAKLEINGNPYLVKLDKPINVSGSVGPGLRFSQASDNTYRTAPPPPVAQPVRSAPANPVMETQNDVSSYVIQAPIPGSILNITVKVGDKVKEGQTVCKMEAMKMENDINAKQNGTVKSISVAVGDAVNQGTELMVIS